MQKNTLIDLWTAFRDTDVTPGGNAGIVICEKFMGWPAGTPVSIIEDFFDKQSAEWGGIKALKEGDLVPERKFQVNTPAGVIDCYAKHESDSDVDYPGVFVDFRFTDEQLTGKQIGKCLAVVEFDSGTSNVQTTTYNPGYDNPSNVKVYATSVAYNGKTDTYVRRWMPATYGQFQKEFRWSIDVLELFDRNHEELWLDPDNIPDDTKILAVHRLGGLFSVVLDIDAEK